MFQISASLLIRWMASYRAGAARSLVPAVVGLCSLAWSASDALAQFGACCIRGSCNGTLTQSECMGQGGIFDGSRTCATMSCPGVHVEFVPSEILVTPGTEFNVGIRVKSISTSSVQMAGIQLIFTWDPTLMELIPPAMENTTAYDWVGFGFTGSGVGGQTLNGSFTDGNAYFEALSQINPGSPKPFATSAGLLIGWAKFRALDISREGPLNVPLTMQVVFNAQPTSVDSLVAWGGAAGIDVLNGVGSFRMMADCNGNGVDDALELAQGQATDCNSNGVLDECENDCNCNNIPDPCDLSCGSPGGVCDVPGCGLSVDVLCTPNGVLDECEPDCDENGLADVCDLQNDPGLDADGNGVLDSCELCGNVDFRDQTINLFDVFCIINAFFDEYSSPTCSFQTADLEPCGGGNGTINLLDLFAVLEALAGCEDCCNSVAWAGCSAAFPPWLPPF